VSAYKNDGLFAKPYAKSMIP